MFAARRVVDSDCRFTGALGVIEHQGWAELADCRSAETLAPCREQDGVLVDEVAGKMRVDITKDWIVFDEWCDAATSRRHRIGGVDRVAESAGVTEKMSRGHSRGIGHGESRE